MASIAEGLPRYRSFDALQRVVKSVDRSGFAHREEAYATPFDAQFAKKNVLETPEFPRPITWVDVKPETPSDKPPVLFLCGLHETPDEAKEAMRFLVNDGRRVLTLYNTKHKRGFLKPGVFPEAILQKALANHLVIEKLKAEEGLSQLDVFGHSMGAAVGILTAAKNADIVRSMTAYGSAGMIDIQDSMTLGFMSINRPLNESIPSILNTLRRPVQTWHETAVAQMDTSALYSVLKDYGIQRLGIFGDHDPLVPFQRVKFFPEEAASAQFDKVIVIKGGRHSDLITNPQEFMGQYTDSLDELDQEKGWETEHVLYEYAS